MGLDGEATAAWPKGRSDRISGARRKENVKELSTFNLFPGLSQNFYHLLAAGLRVFQE